MAGIICEPAWLNNKTIILTCNLVNIKNSTTARGTQATPEDRHRALNARENSAVAFVIIRRQNVANYFIEFNLSLLTHIVLLYQDASKTSKINHHLLQHVRFWMHMCRICKRSVFLQQFAKHRLHFLAFCVEQGRSFSNRFILQIYEPRKSKTLINRKIHQNGGTHLTQVPFKYRVRNFIDSGDSVLQMI